MIGIVDSDIKSRRKRVGANKYTAYTYVTDTEKRCSLCEKIKPHSEFHKDPKNIRAKGLAYYCKDCANRKSREHHKRKHASSEEYRLAKKANYIKSRFNISLEKYNELLENQKFVCGICGIYLKKHKHFAHLDHDHSTGKIREFLCTNCNRGLGHFMDSPQLLIKAATYITKHKELDRALKDDTSL